MVLVEFYEYLVRFAEIIFANIKIEDKLINLLEILLPLVQVKIRYPVVADEEIDC